MKIDLCDRPERNARPFDDDSGQGGIPDSDGIILGPNQNDSGLSGNSVFESSSCESSSSTIEENLNSLLDRFFNFFGSGSGESMYAAPADTSRGSTDSPFIGDAGDFCPSD